MGVSCGRAPNLPNLIQPFLCLTLFSGVASTISAQTLFSSKVFFIV